MKSNFIEKRRRKKIWQEYPVFPGGHPSKRWQGSMLLNLVIQFSGLYSSQDSNQTGTVIQTIRYIFGY